jgi:hypothetical protein
MGTFATSGAFRGQPLSLGPRNIIVAENTPVPVVAVVATCEPDPRKKLRQV